MVCPIRPFSTYEPTPAENGESAGVVPNVTPAPGEDPNAYPYVDVPQLCYSDWLKSLEAPDKGIGQFEDLDKLKQYKVLIIGAGVSGASAAYELAKIGVNVTVVDAEPTIGGRAASTAVPCNENSDSKNLIELGAMRFPASESVMDHYVQKFKILDGKTCKSFVDKTNIFPDPGKVPTVISRDGVVQKPYWTIDNKGKKYPLPKHFHKVNKGWTALITQPLTRCVDGKVTEFANQLQTKHDPKEKHPPLQKSLRQLLQGRNVSEAKKQWQIWINEFEHKSFYSAMYDIFTGRNGWIIPGGSKWDFDDFDRFGQLGVGSGGFGSLYPINFLEIIRLIVNGLESTQYFFPPGIRALPKALLKAAQGKDADNHVNTKATLHNDVLVTKVKGAYVPSQKEHNGKSGDDSSAPSRFKIETKQGHPVEKDEFDRVIVATTIRSMECTMNVAGALKPELDPDTEKEVVGKLISKCTANAVRRVHTTSSIKVAAQIKKYWQDQDEDTPRCFLSDDIVKQVYTLEYEKEHKDNKPDTAVCFMTYSWDDDAIRQQGLGVSLDATVDKSQPSQGQTYSVDKRKLYKTLHQRMQYLAKQNDKDLVFARFVEGLYPYNPTCPKDPKHQDYPEDAILFVEWQSLPTYNAAFKLSEPGQDKYVQTMFYDYQKAGTENDTGVYLAGDTIAWTAGWIEGGLYTGLNAAAGIVKSLGGKVNSQPTNPQTHMKGNPMELDKCLFNYFPVDPKNCECDENSDGGD